jgi:tetratricopeptide (TPR) repeat protein
MAIAQVRFQKGNLAQAKEAAEKILQMDKGDEFARIMKGRVLVKERKFQEALEIFQKVLQNNQKSEEAYYYQAVAHFGLGQENMGRNSLQKALEHGPENVKALLLMARLHMRDQALDRAEELCSRAIQANPASLRAHLLRGRIAMAQKNLNEAEKAFRKVTELAPNNHLGPLYLGQLSMLRENRDEAISHFRTALDHNPYSTQAIRNIVLAYMLENRTDAALQFCKDQLDKHSSNNKLCAFIYTTQATIHLRNKNAEQAKRSYMQAIDNYPEWPTPYLQLARVYSSLGKVDEAIVQFEKVHEKNPKHMPALMNLGILYQHKGELEQAKRYYQKCLDVKQDFAPAANNLAWLLVETGGNIDKALSLAQTAKRLRPDDPSISDTLGWVYVHKNAYGSAIAQFEDALDKMPQNPTVHYHMAVAQHKQGNRQEALESLKNALESKQPFPEKEKAVALREELAG